jgi:NAD(P)-dependent dehydrogenase (short-subunit alcohol dehydrogenase family)
VSEQGAVVVVGGTSGLGKAIAAHYERHGTPVVITGRDEARAQEIAGEIGGGVSAVALDLASPETIPDQLARIGAVEHLVLAAIERSVNTTRDFDLTAATRLATVKLVGSVAVIQALLPRMTENGSILIFGGRAKDRPYPGSTMVSTVNGGVTGLVNTLVVELAPIRVNAIHPGIVGDTPAWEGKDAALDAVRARTPTGRLVSTDEITSASVFLLENGGVNGVNLYVDGGTMLL